jgi:GntR family transcriptional regulator / MocR family aminotransferase
MARTPSSLLFVDLDRALPVPLHRQVYARLREAILAGRLPRGRAMPSTRTLARDLSVSRNTVLTAYEQLHAEGYLDGRIGSGSYVCAELPDAPAIVTGEPAPDRPATPRQPSSRGAQLATVRVSSSRGSLLRAFRPGVPALDAFPAALWSRIAARAWRDATRSTLAYGDPAGYAPLRQAIADYLRASRAVRCEPHQIVITAGTQQALSLLAHVLLDEGDAVWFEEPGYLGARSALTAAKLTLVPVAVDDEGLSVKAGIERAPSARAAYLTPSHQYPLGVTMSLMRRLDLLRWARAADAWIVEDDYDSEFRYEGRPLASLQGLDTDDRVIYCGTFSKVLCPALRLGYLVVPDALVDTFIRARAINDRQGPTPNQAALAQFITEGHFERHVRRMRMLYKTRQDALVTAARRELAGLIDVAPRAAGMHLVAWLPPDRDDREASDRALAAGVDAPPLSAFCATDSPRPALVLGYGCIDESGIEAGVTRLASALREPRR